MSKREASNLAPQGIDIDAPRAKRHKPGPGSQASPPRKGKESQQQHDGDIQMEDTVAKVEENGESGDDREGVKEKGLKLWQVVKDAVNKEGRVLSNDFLRLPSKRQYPDYYQLIKAPVALDEIKTRLDKKDYATFEDVKQDLERCFKNAKRYNMKDSQIWKDAKHLHKLVTKEAAALTGTEAPVGDGDDADEHHPGSDGEEGGEKKKKQPNMFRLLKARLEKLVNLADPNGRTRSTEFMELPSKKKWPVYYKTIKKPQCLENIFKKIKRKEYNAPVDFANDVELVFSNALEFNQEHSELWEDAIALRDYFRQLMSDLPAPFTIPAYATSDHSTKIRLKKPKPEGTTASTPVANTGTPGTLVLRVPGQHTAPTQASSSATPHPPTKPPKTSAKAAATPKSKQTPAKPKPATATPSGTLQPATFAQPANNHYPNAGYQPTRAGAATSLPNTNTIHPYMKPTQIQMTPSTPKTLHLHTQITPAPAVTPTLTPTPVPVPTPVYQPPIAPLQLTTANVTSLRTPTPTTPLNSRQLRSVSLDIRPSGRRLGLDHKLGVRIWALRLSHSDTSIHISDVKFLIDAEEEEEESDDEVEVEAHEEEEEEEENGENEPERPSKRTRGRPKRGSKPKAKDVKGKGKAVVTTKKSHEEIQVKLNGIVVKGTPSGGKKPTGWTVELGTGINLVEVGEKDGSSWKVYLERPAAP